MLEELTYAAARPWMDRCAEPRMGFLAQQLINKLGNNKLSSKAELEPQY